MKKIISIMIMHLLLVGCGDEEHTFYSKEFVAKTPDEMIQNFIKHKNGWVLKDTTIRVSGKITDESRNGEILWLETDSEREFKIHLLDTEKNRHLKGYWIGTVKFTCTGGAHIYGSKKYEGENFKGFKIQKDHSMAVYKCTPPDDYDGDMIKRYGL